MKKKISVYTRSGNIYPSGYYRILSYMRNLPVEYKVRGQLSEKYYERYYSSSDRFTVISLIRKAHAYFTMLYRVLFFLLLDRFIYKPDIIIISRVILPRKTPGFYLWILNNLLEKTKMIWDFDDHILDSLQITPSLFSYFSEKSSYITVTHNFLKSLIDTKYQNKVIILPTTDGDMLHYELEKLNIERKSKYDTKIDIAWVGTSTNVQFVEKILPELDKAGKILRKKFNKELHLFLVANKRVYTRYEGIMVHNVTWTRERAIEIMAKSQIGIMPLTDSLFCQGKGGFKLIQYLSVGLPVIGSDVGFNKEIIDPSNGYLIKDKDTGKWTEAVIELSTDILKWEKMSLASRKKYDTHFLYDNNLQVWKNLISKLP